MTLTPEARVSYFSETSAAYTDSLAVEIPEITVAYGTAELGPMISRDWVYDDGSAVSVLLQFEGIYTFGKEVVGNVNEGTLILEEGLRGRVNTGLTYTGANGLSASASISYDGIGTEGYEVWGAELGFGYEY